MPIWRLTWTLTATDVLQGLTRTVEGRLELGLFAPRIVAVYAVEKAMQAAGVTDWDVVGLEIRMERTGPAE